MLFYRIKEGSKVNPIIYYWKNKTLPYEDLELTTEETFLDGTGKTISYGGTEEEFKALVSRREQVFGVSPA